MAMERVCPLGIGCSTGRKADVKSCALGLRGWTSSSRTVSRSLVPPVTMYLCSNERAAGCYNVLSPSDVRRSRLLLSSTFDFWLDRRRKGSVQSYISY
jgi:hypothetical protein